MRHALVAVMIVVLSGCTSMGGPRPHPPADRARETPVAKELPSPTRKSTARRLRDGQEATGKIEVEGPLIR